jgi:triacylglycerol esterase/lipase EstA (alpha/beta hydrolase family)
MFGARLVLVSGLLVSGCATDASLGVVDLSTGAIVGEDAGAAPPRPIVLVAGMTQDEATVAPLATALRAKGFDVTLFVPPNDGLDDIHGYAKQLRLVVETVLRNTNAANVDLIGHSEGGLTARRYVKDQLEGAPVQNLISLGSPQQGTDLGALNFVLRAGGVEYLSIALEQMISGSDFLKELNGGDATPGDVRYVTIGTREDIVTQPVAHAGIPGAENLDMQALCPERRVGHFGLFEDGWVLEVISAVLAGEAASGNCQAKPLGGGI